MSIFLAALALCTQPELSKAEDIRVCPLNSTQEGCDRLGLEAALAEARDGETLLIRAGIYEEAGVLRANGVTLRGELGTHLRGVAAEAKAALVIQGDEVTVENLECSGINVPDGNGACIRAEGRDLTVRKVHFHDSQEGLLGGLGNLLVEDSLFERLGGDIFTEVGQAHGIYASHLVERFELRRNRFLSSKEEGHEVKSRARVTIIEDNVIASLDGKDSRLIDVPNGGEVIIRGNILEIGPNSSHPDLIGLGLERGREPELDHETNRALIENNTFIVDYVLPSRLVHADDFPDPVFRNNVVVGGTPQGGQGNRWFVDRAAAGLPPYPALRLWRDPAAVADPEVTRLPAKRLLLDREEGVVLWRSRPVMTTDRGVALLALLSGEEGKILSFEEIFDRLESEGVFFTTGAGPDKQEQLLALALGLRRSFREIDRSFDALVYRPGQGLGWQE